MTKLGLIAGGGDLPLALAAHCRDTGRPLFVVRLAGFADAGLSSHEGADAGIVEVGRILRLCKEAGCGALCLAGNVRRPDMANLRLDMKGVTLLPGIVAAARQGDEALLRYLTRALEREGFVVEGAHQVMGDLVLAPGALGRVTPRAEHEADIAKALQIARGVGAMDIGQGAVVCDGLVLAVEAQEGTDAMLARVAGLPPALRGDPRRRRGVLAKVAKPIQEDRVDLPTIGVATVEGASRAGLAGIVGVAGRTLVIDREAVARAAEASGLFIVGAADELA
ncbi:MAG TPA: UDP-2,3-diacylglucosamine diphosphatase LpxI [Caulobacteraceae bacterium]|nr:UDP-2,3-diacylglucosamine diphosphatase LpxI [Caulobacteraceae bacterium]